MSRHRRGRMYAALEMRNRGLSLREIARALECSHTTVRRDLAAARRALEHLAGTKSPAIQPKTTLECSKNVPAKLAENGSAQIIPLRRKA